MGWELRAWVGSCGREVEGFARSVVIFPKFLDEPSTSGRLGRGLAVGLPERGLAKVVASGGVSPSGGPSYARCIDNWRASDSDGVA